MLNLVVSVAMPVVVWMVLLGKAVLNYGGVGDITRHVVMTLGVATAVLEVTMLILMMEF